MHNVSTANCGSLFKVWMIKHEVKPGSSPSCEYKNERMASFISSLGKTWSPISGHLYKIAFAAEKKFKDLTFLGRYTRKETKLKINI